MVVNMEIGGGFCFSNILFFLQRLQVTTKITLYELHVKCLSMLNTSFTDFMGIDSLNKPERHVRQRKSLLGPQKLLIIL